MREKFRDRREPFSRGAALAPRSGKASELAKWTVQENADGKPSLQLVPWRAFPTAAVVPRTA
jgi:hypothetical protein